MTQVLADIAGMFELFAIASGLLLLDRELTQTKLLKTAGNGCAVHELLLVQRSVASRD